MEQFPIPWTDEFKTKKAKHNCHRQLGIAFQELAPKNYFTLGKKSSFMK
jgi:hypothetical protein